VRRLPLRSVGRALRLGLDNARRDEFIQTGDGSRTLRDE
jgi:hypothetical protein